MRFWILLLFPLSAIGDSSSPARVTVRPADAEARALWVTRFDYDSEAKIVRIMETASRANFNIIYFQARAAGDAYYRSSIEPCAALLCGTLGGTPAYDPLEVAVREGHARGLQGSRVSQCAHRARGRDRGNVPADHRVGAGQSEAHAPRASGVSDV